MAKMLTGDDRPPGHTCMVEGCPEFGVFQPTPQGEPFYFPDHPKSHYRRFHYPEQEAEYAKRVAADQARRHAYYREHGKWLPPDV